MHPPSALSRSRAGAGRARVRVKCIGAAPLSAVGDDDGPSQSLDSLAQRALGNSSHGQRPPTLRARPRLLSPSVQTHQTRLLCRLGQIDTLPSWRWTAPSLSLLPRLDRPLESINQGRVAHLKRSTRTRTKPRSTTTSSPSSININSPTRTNLGSGRPPRRVRSRSLADSWVRIINSQTRARLTTLNHNSSRLGRMEQGGINSLIRWGTRQASGAVRTRLTRCMPGRSKVSRLSLD